MKKDLKSLQIAAVGWDHEGWLSDFYPHDLPAEWRLAYYANEFREVLVTESTWLSEPLPDPEQWYGETPEGFRFYILVTAELLQQPDMSSVVMRLNSLEEKLGGVLIDGRSDTLPRIARTLKTMCPSMQIFEETGELVDVGVRLWHSDQGNSVVRYKCAPQHDLKMLRKDLERFVETSKGKECVIFIEGDIKDLHDATVIARLLGY